MKSCYHKSCDNYIEARKNEKRYNNSLAFLTKTTQALVLTILDLTTNDFNNWVDKDNATYDHSTANHYRNQRDIPIKLRRDKGVDISTFTGLYFYTLMCSLHNLVFSSFFIKKMNSKLTKDFHW